MANGAEKRQVANQITRQARRAPEVKLFTGSQGVSSVRRWRVTPIDVMLSAMHEGLAEQQTARPWEGISETIRNGGRFTRQQFDAAVACAPYVHPKLNAVAYKEAPDRDRERRRSLLASIPFEKRREIAALLASAQQQEDDDVAAVVEGVVTEEAEGGGK